MQSRSLALALLVPALAGSLSCMPTLEGSDVNLAGQQVRLTFLHTSDIHSRLVPFDFSPLRTDTDLGLIPEAAPFGGATRLAALVARERARADRVLHLDSGDCFQGAPIYNLNNGEVEFKFLSLLWMDAAVVGNHEFDSGALNFANQARDNANFPLLSANYIWEDYKALDSHQAGKYTQPYTIKNVKGLKVAIIGMANVSSLNSIVEGGNSLQVVPYEQNEAARAYVELLKPVVDLVVMVSHLGLHEDQELVQGYEAFYEYGRAREFITRESSKWQVLEWFGPEGADSSVVRVKIPGVSGIDIILGGHLHVVLNPPQLLTDLDGRKVLLAHSGAFAKYLGRLEVVVQMPLDPEREPNHAELLSHDFRVFPIDSLWCSDDLHRYYRSQFWAPGEFRKQASVIAGTQECIAQEHRLTAELLQPYVLQMDFNFGLTSIFSYAPRDITRRNNSSGGDAPLGNIAADSMRKRRRVEAEVALTNSLGIRDNLYKGPVTQEGMFNVFPFENTINIMYLSGIEMQELFDFVTERSAGRGCGTQAQISGARFTMDCAQVQLNDVRLACEKAEDCGAQLPTDTREGRNPWECRSDQDGNRCYAHPASNITVNGKGLDPAQTYKIAVNDYIAKGGSGFAVLKRNTTRIETGISLRDSLIGYMKNFCSCDDINAGRSHSSTGQPCGNLIGGEYIVDDQAKSFCEGAQAFKAVLEQTVQNVSDQTGQTLGSCDCKQVLANDQDACGGQIGSAAKATCSALPGPALASCSCRDALTGNTTACGNITSQLKTFCENPTAVAIAIGAEDGRIGRRVK